MEVMMHGWKDKLTVFSYQNRIIAEDIKNIKRILTKRGQMLKITKIYKRSNLFLANKKKKNNKFKKHK